MIGSQNKPHHDARDFHIAEHVLKRLADHFARWHGAPFIGVEARPIQHLTALTFTSAGEDGAVAFRAWTHNHSEVWVGLSRTADISQIRQNRCLTIVGF
ncbi:hypothetical protein CWO90_43620 [Bradyrhizobium sp. Leo121]|nr:hypothetical protein CWO90_43620 [Bradyrhizobium sp. Leo121]